MLRLSFISIFTLALILSAWLVSPMSATASGALAIFDNLPMTGSTDVPTGLTMSAGQGITLYYTVGDAAKCKPVESSFNRQTVTVSSTSDANQYGFFSVESNWNETTNRYFRLKDPTMSELLPQTTYAVILKGGDQGIAIQCSTSLTSNTYHLVTDFTTSFTTGRDTVPPTISQTKVKATTNQAILTWSTNQSSDTQVAYGLSASLGQFSASNSQPQRSHSMTVTGLIPGNIYYYQVLSKDEAGNLATEAGQFSTLVIGNLKADNLAGHEATIIWTTNQPTDSMVEYGPSTAYNQRSGSTALTSQHTVRLTNLDSSTVYHFRVKATAANGISYSADQQFQTNETVGGATVSLTQDIYGEAIQPDLTSSPLPQVLAATDAIEPSSQKLEPNVDPSEIAPMKQGINWVVWISIPVVLAGLCAGMYLILRHQHRIGRLRQAG